jgi:hypothetical protein
VKVSNDAEQDPDNNRGRVVTACVRIAQPCALTALHTQLRAHLHTPCSHPHTQASERKSGASERVDAKVSKDMPTCLLPACLMASSMTRGRMFMSAPMLNASMKNAALHTAVYSCASSSSLSLPCVF